eukprot:m.104954 g.104954  ORF g.104954 m.104954 type:complete len:257 (-) comp12624_c0_seq1:123-893(-)
MYSAVAAPVHLPPQHPSYAVMAMSAGFTWHPPHLMGRRTIFAPGQFLGRHYRPAHPSFVNEQVPQTPTIYPPECPRNLKSRAQPLREDYLSQRSTLQQSAGVPVVPPLKQESTTISQSTVDTAKSIHKQAPTRSQAEISAARSAKGKKTVNGKYACPMCDRSFSNSSNRARHKRVHTGEKPFTCAHCNYAFANASNRKKHEQTCNSGPACALLKMSQPFDALSRPSFSSSTLFYAPTAPIAWPKSTSMFCPPVAPA